MFVEYPTERLVFDYGYAVMRRERCADGLGDFDGWNQSCLAKWHEMKARGCYQESEGYKLFPQWEKYYYAGLDGKRFAEIEDGTQ